MGVARGSLTSGRANGMGTRTGLVGLAAALALLLAGCDLLSGGPKVGPGLEPPDDMVPGIDVPGAGAAGSNGAADPDPQVSEPDDGPDPMTPPPATSDPSNDFGNSGAGGNVAPPPTAGAAGAAPAEPTAPMAGGSAEPPGSAGTDAPNSCGLESHWAVPATDLYLVVDESLAMVEPDDLWTPLSQALQGWLTSTTTAGLEVALLGYQAACEADAYSQPSVTWGALPEHADALLAGMQAGDHTDGGATAQALSGAIQQARTRSTSSGAPAAVVLLTAAQPSACGSTMFSTSLMASAGNLGTPSIPTYVVGLGTEAAAYNQVAAVGGTSSAIVVTDPTSTAAVQQGLDALLSQAVCTFALPPEAQGFDPTLINVWIDDATGSHLVPYAPAGCGSTGGWVFSALSPEPLIELCPASCQELADGGGRVHFEIGCETVSE